MLCWICSSPAETGEHLVKVTDLRDMFGYITTHTPLYRRRDLEPHDIVQGVRSPKLKFESPLCGECNNKRTQQHDKSWEALAGFLRDRSPPIRPGDIVRPAKAFRTGLRPGMLGVHLFFAKHFGCLVGDGDAPIDRAPLAEAILNTKPVQHLYLSFIVVTNARLARQAIVTPISAFSVAGAEGATYYYFAGRIAVQVVLAPIIARKSKTLHLWHPLDSSKTITLDGK
jgi:hypothetical protein